MVLSQTPPSLLVTLAESFGYPTPRSPVLPYVLQPKGSFHSVWAFPVEMVPYVGALESSRETITSWSPRSHFTVCGDQALSSHRVVGWPLRCCRVHRACQITVNINYLWFLLLPRHCQVCMCASVMARTHMLAL